MKAQLLKFTVVLLILAGLATDCGPKCLDCPVYPNDISFTEYSLEGTSCQWQNLPYDKKVIIINSSEELKKYISCNGGNYPAIDFSKQSLVLFSGKTDRLIDKITVEKFKQFSSDTYKLRVEIALKFSTLEDQFDQYAIALLVEKIDKEKIVELNVTLKEPKIILPMEVIDQNILFFFDSTFRYKSHMGNSLFFAGIHYSKDTCFMINTMQEFRQACIFPEMVPEIDFENYTLIIGKIYVSDLGFYVVDQKVFEDSALTLLVRNRSEGSGIPSMGVLYHWGLYPKLPDKPFYVEYIRIY